MVGRDPLPFFLCIVDKASARIRVYHTSPRFYVWSLPPLPGRIELVPTTDGEGRCTQWQGSTTFSLSAPILDATIQDLLDDGFHRQAWEVMLFWIGSDLENLARIKAGIHSFTMPDQYTTNKTEFGGRVTQGIMNAPDLTSAMERVKETVAYLSSQLNRKGDLPGAVRCAMLLRYFFKSDTSGGTHDPHLHNTINTLIRGQWGITLT